MSTEVLASSDDTIVALATPAGRSSVAIIRVSGAGAKSIARQITQKELQPRRAEFTQFLDQDEEIIDQGVALFFGKPNSYTGEDILELHSHGSLAITEQLLKTAVSFGARLARPGEFTERAYMNGKLDLLQAEAVADLIDSSTANAAKSTIRTLQGVFSKEVQSLCNELISLRAYVEGALDFPEEEINFLAEGDVEQRLKSVINKLEQTYRRGEQGKKLHDGVTVAILGEPNTGKSSLLNQLSGYDAAIVTEIPGTTRDLLEHDIIIEGLLFKLTDTAGIRESDDPIEQEGIKRAKRAAEQSDCIVLMTSCEEEQEDFFMGSDIENKQTIIVRNKIDLCNERALLVETKRGPQISLSAKTGEGLDLFIKTLKELVSTTATVEGSFTANQRHLDALKKAQKSLSQALTQLQTRQAGELLAEDLRKAQEHVGEITGEFYPDDLLGEIFSRFCIGK